MALPGKDLRDINSAATSYFPNPSTISHTSFLPLHEEKSFFPSPA